MHFQVLKVQVTCKKNFSGGMVQLRHECFIWMPRWLSPTALAGICIFIITDALFFRPASLVPPEQELPQLVSGKIFAVKSFCGIKGLLKPVTWSCYFKLGEVGY